jgi:hypothetical protein
VLLSVVVAAENCPLLRICLRIADQIDGVAQGGRTRGRHDSHRTRLDETAGAPTRCGVERTRVQNTWTALVAGSLLLSFVVRLNKRTKVTTSLMIRYSGLAVGVSAPGVVGLPLHRLSLGDPRCLLNLPRRAT